MGVNLVTGDYSSRSFGPVDRERRTGVSGRRDHGRGNLKDIFKNISEIEATWNSARSVASPTIRIDGLTVGGE